MCRHSDAQVSVYLLPVHKCTVLPRLSCDISSLPTQPFFSVLYLSLLEPPRASAASTIAWVRIHPFWAIVTKTNTGYGGYYVAGRPLLNGRCTSLLGAPVSEMTCTVSSGTLNSTIPCHDGGSDCIAVQVKERRFEGDAQSGHRQILSAWRSAVSTERYVQQASQQAGGRYVQACIVIIIDGRA